MFGSVSQETKSRIFMKVLIKKREKQTSANFQWMDFKI